MCSLRCCMELIFRRLGSLTLALPTDSSYIDLFGTRLTNVSRSLRARDPDEALAASASSKAAFGAVPQFDLTPRFSKPGQRWQIC